MALDIEINMNSEQTNNQYMHISLCQIPLLFHCCDCQGVSYGSGRGSRFTLAKCEGGRSGLSHDEQYSRHGQRRVVSTYNHTETMHTLDLDKLPSTG